MTEKKNNEVAVKYNEVSLFLNGIKESLSSYQIVDYDQRKFLSSVMLCIIEDENLKKAIGTHQGKITLTHALRYAAGTGLSLNPQEGKSALIAYAGKIQYQVMKNGLLELAERSGKVKFISTDTVRKNDKFEIVKTMDGDRYSFTPARTDRGEIQGFFAAIKTDDGFSHVMYMTINEVAEHRDKYSSLYKNKPDASPWKKSFEGMALKTVLKKLFRNVKISDELTHAISSDDSEENGFNVEKGVGSEDLKSKMNENVKDAEFEIADNGGSLI